MVRVNKVLDLLSLLILTQLSFGFPKPTVGTFKPSKVSCRLCWYLKSKSSYIKSNRWISGLIFLTVHLSIAQYNARWTAVQEVLGSNPGLGNGTLSKITKILFLIEDISELECWHLDSASWMFWAISEKFWAATEKFWAATEKLWAATEKLWAASEKLWAASE